MVISGGVSDGFSSHLYPCIKDVVEQHFVENTPAVTSTVPRDDSGALELGLCCTREEEVARMREVDGNSGHFNLDNNSTIYRFC